MKKIFITVDLECHDIIHRNQYIDGKYKSGVCGLELILQLGKELGIPINFFFDIVEAKEYGIDYAKEIIDLIHSYNQHVYLHLHPDYVTGNHSKSFLWQYSYSEKKEILRYGFNLFEELLGHKPKAFRIGRYGADEEMYRAMSELEISIVDLSYSSGSEKMCHINKEVLSVDNCICEYREQTIFPNTRYIAFRIGKKRKLINVDANDSTFNEFRSFLDSNTLNNITLTMHSWNFIKKYFFSKKYVSLDKNALKKFKKMVSYAKEKGYAFSDFENVIQKTNCKDELLDLSGNKILMIINNFIRFQKIGRLNKKYFIIYFIFYLLLLVLFLGCLILVKGV